MIDIHAHVLPGIDDGAERLADGVAMVRELAEQGVTGIVATPHYVDETIYSSPRRENLKLLDELRAAVADTGVELYLGNEIYINERIDELVRMGKVSALAGSGYVLVELPMSGRYPGYEDVLAELMAAGYKVVLAHPERYVAVQEDYALVENLYEMGVLLQCNLGSVVGQYGKHAKKTVQRLIKERKVFAWGSDIHHCRGEEYWRGVWKKMRKYYSAEELEQVLVANPGKIVGR